MYPNIKTELVKRGITYSELAEILKLPKSGITDRMKGKTDWRIKEIENLLRITECSFQYLFLRK